MKVAPGANTVPVGTVTSAMNSALSQTEGNTVGVGGTGVNVEVGDAPGVGECVTAGTGDSTGVVGDVPGVGGGGVDVLPVTVRLPGAKSMAVSVFVPCDTRALHSTAV